MKLTCFRALSVSAVLAFALSPLSSAQSPASQNREADHRAALEKFVTAAAKMAPETRRHLSPAMQNYLAYTSALINGSPVGASASIREESAAVHRPGLIPVSNPALDPGNEGFTQDTSATAWCGHAIVVGYDDSGAFLRSDPTLGFGVPISVANVSYSHDAGRSFHDIGFVNPGTFSANAILGEPAVTCTSAEHFQLASILNTTTPDGLDPIIGPSLSTSADGGKTWSNPFEVVSLDGNTQLADQPWLAVDPGNPHRMYLSFTEVDFLTCTSIDLVRSADGGKTWSTPVFVDQECNTPSTVAGSRVTVGPDGDVFVTYEFFPALSASQQRNAIFFAKSINHGATFGTPIKVSDLVPGGDGLELQGHLIVNEFPQIAVDRSSRHSRGSIYITYPDGRDHVVSDASSPTGTYAYPDIFVAKSTDSGRSFTVLGPVSRTPRTFTGAGRDQFLPSVAVDEDGLVAVCYYDRRDDPADLRVDRFCSVSHNQGHLWHDQQESGLDWTPLFNIDPLSGSLGPAFGIGEYNSLASDFLLRNDGFFGVFVIENNGNQDLVATRF